MKTSSFDAVTIFQLGKQIGSKILYPVYAFLIDKTLIDTGSKSAEKHFIPEIQKYACRQIINTHSHEDHIGNNKKIQDFFEIPIFCHFNAQKVIENPRIDSYLWYQRFCWKIPDASKTIPISEKIHTEHHELEVIHTPGHAPGHICLYEPVKKWIFTGDLYLGSKTTYLRPRESFQAQLSSLKTIVQLKPEYMFCGFRGFLTNATSRLSEKIRNMESLQEKTLYLQKEGNSPKSIRKKLLGKEDAMKFLTHGNFSKQNLIDIIMKENNSDI